MAFTVASLPNLNELSVSVKKASVPLTSAGRPASGQLWPRGAVTR